MKTKHPLLMLAYILSCIALTLAIADGTALWLFWNPINWKNYTDYTTFDRVWVWLSNLTILSVGIALIVVTWVGLREVRIRMIRRYPFTVDQDNDKGKRCEQGAPGYRR